MKRMNTQMEKMFDKYNVSPKTRHDLVQIYSLLPLEKQRNIMHNFATLVWRIEDIETQMKKEQEILLDRIIPDITDIIANNYSYKMEGEIKILSSAI